MNSFRKSPDSENRTPLSQFATISHSYRHLTIAAAVALAISGCSTPRFSDGLEQDEYEIIDETYSTGNNFSKRIYGSAGLGASRLDPDTSQNATFDVNDRVGPAGQVTLGADLSKTFSVEIHSTELGSAGLSPGGSISYNLNGGSALLYAGGDRSNRRGFSGYGRVGVGAMDNSASGNVTFRRENDTQLLVGAGAEYGWRNGFGVRGEVIVFDEDAQFAQLGLIYRLGSSTSNRLAELPTDLPASAPPTAVVQAPTRLIAPVPQQLLEAPPESLPEPLPAAAAKPATSANSTDSAISANSTDSAISANSANSAEEDPLAKYTADSDQDGIFDTLDDCPASTVGIAVDENGCAVFNGVIDGVNFERGSDRLTETARSVLDDVVTTLADQPDALIAIGAHTDSNGNENDNMALSRNRAITVAKYLINRGVPKNLMSARAFGELVPIADNQSSEGRAQNRRVELVASKGIAQ